MRGFRGGNFSRGFQIRGLGAYVPGARPQFLRDDLALELPKHHDLLMQMHFHPSGKAEVEQSSVGIWFADKPPSQEIKQIQLPSLFGFMSGIDIPAGEAGYKIEQSLKLPVDVEGISVGGHAHYICKTMRLTARLPDGTTKTLLSGGTARRAPPRLSLWGTAAPSVSIPMDAWPRTSSTPMPNPTRKRPCGYGKVMKRWMRGIPASSASF